MKGETGSVYILLESWRPAFLMSLRCVLNPAYDALFSAKERGMHEYEMQVYAGVSYRLIYMHSSGVCIRSMLRSELFMHEQSILMRSAPSVLISFAYHVTAYAGMTPLMSCSCS